MTSIPRKSTLLTVEQTLQNAMERAESRSMVVRLQTRTLRIHLTLRGLFFALKPATCPEIRES